MFALHYWDFLQLVCVLFLCSKLNLFFILSLCFNIRDIYIYLTSKPAWHFEQQCETLFLLQWTNAIKDQAFFDIKLVITQFIENYHKDLSHIFGSILIAEYTAITICVLNNYYLWYFQENGIQSMFSFTACIVTLFTQPILFNLRY